MALGFEGITPDVGLERNRQLQSNHPGDRPADTRVSVMKPIFLQVISLCLAVISADTLRAAVPDTPADRAWLDTSKPVEVRVRLLEEQLTLEEKASLLYWLAPAIDRLGIKAYDHGNECLHGLVRPGLNTCYPQAIGLGSTFDPELVRQMASAISDEARARWNAAPGKHLGTYSDVLTLWSPVVNMARDPRWGRTQETYGEDPWLTSRMGVAFVEGLQGNDPNYLKVIATPKHFATNSQENGRFGKNVQCGERYLFEYEFFPFRACVQEAKAGSVMASYTAINGVPSSVNPWLLTDVLRRRWGFKGYVVSDCGAISHVVDAYHYVGTPEAAIAAALNAGCDLEGGYFATYPDLTNNYLKSALDKGLVTQQTIDTALTRVLTGRFKLGMFDPEDGVPYSKIPESVICSPEHAALARKLACESIVLLKNDRIEGAPLLPIDAGKVREDRYRRSECGGGKPRRLLRRADVCRHALAGAESTRRTGGHFRHGVSVAGWNSPPCADERARDRRARGVARVDRPVLRFPRT